MFVLSFFAYPSLSALLLFAQPPLSSLSLFAYPPLSSLSLFAYHHFSPVLLLFAYLLSLFVLSLFAYRSLSALSRVAYPPLSLRSITRCLPLGLLPPLVYNSVDKQLPRAACRHAATPSGWERHQRASSGDDGHLWYNWRVCVTDRQCDSHRVVTSAQIDTVTL